MEKFGKAYKLCSRKRIDELFKKGTKIYTYPFTVFWMEESFEEKVAFQVVLSVPKRLFKRAHDRNYVKRIMKECLRKEKAELQAYLDMENKQLSLVIVYNNKEILAYEEMLKASKKMLAKLQQEVSK